MKSVTLLLILDGILLLSAYRQRPVAVGSAEPPTKRVCVVGNVAKQGDITFDDQLLLTDAIAKAGGLLPHSKYINILESNEGKVGALEIRFDANVIRKKSFRNHELPDLSLIFVSTKKDHDVPPLPPNICSWASRLLRSRM